LRPSEAREEPGGELLRRVAPAVTTGNVDDESAQRGLQRAFARCARRWRSAEAARRNWRTRVGTQDAIDEAALLSPTWIETESLACCLELVATEALQNAPEVERTLPYYCVHVRGRGPTVLNIEPEPRRELGETLSRELT
jgi:hypothetical protein